MSRQQVVAAAAELLATEGPSGLSARALARAVDASTMAVYTQFSGMPAVVHAVIEEAFDRLDAHLADYLSRLRDGTPQDAEPMDELRAIALAYRDNALANPHLYAVMFGGPAAIGMELTAEDLSRARGSLRTVAEAAGRARDRGLLLDVDEWELARRLWAAGHGAILLELGGYLGSREQAERTYVAVIEALLVGLAPFEVKLDDQESPDTSNRIPRTDPG